MGSGPLAAVEVASPPLDSGSTARARAALVSNFRMPLLKIAD